MRGASDRSFNASDEDKATNGVTGRADSRAVCGDAGGVGRSIQVVTTE